MDTIAFDSPEQVRLGTLASHCSTRFNRFYFGAKFLNFSSKDIVDKD